MKGLYSEATGFTQLMITLFVAFSLMLFLLGLQYVGLWIIYKPASFAEFNFLLSNNVNLLKLMQATQAVGLFIFPAFIASFLLTKTNVSHYLSLKNTANIHLYMLVVMAAVFALPPVNVLAKLNEAITFPPFLQNFELWARGLENEAKIVTDRFLSVSTIPDLLINILVIAVLAAVGEELIFRGVLQRIFINWTQNETLGIWITAFVFSALHFQFFGFLPRLLLGAYFGYLLVWTRTMWAPILAHFIHNGIMVLVFYLHYNGYITINPDEVGINDMLWLALASGILFLGMVYLIRVRCKM